MATIDEATLLFDLRTDTVRELNRRLHEDMEDGPPTRVRVLHPGGRHAIAVGLDAEVLADLARARELVGGGPGQVNGVGAGLVDLAAGAGADRAHVK